MRAIAIVVLLLVAACSTPAAPPVEPSLGPVPTVHAVADVRRPIDAYRIAPEKLVQLAQIQDQLANECRRRHGLPEDAGTEGDIVAFIGSPVEREARFSPLWGSFDPHTMRTSGYQSSDPSTNDTHLGSGDEALSAQCWDEAMKAFPGGQGWFNLVFTSTWPAGGPPVPVEDSRLVAAREQWSACMRSRGFTGASDPVTVSLSYTRLANTTPTPEELATATVDLECKLQTNLVGVGAAVQAAYDTEYLRQHQAELLAWLEQVDTFIATHA